LTLDQVAGNVVSRTAIHLIEKGHVLPSIETLMLIARQTNRPLSFFMENPESPGPLGKRKRIQMATLYLSQALADSPATHAPSVQAKVCMMLGQVEEWSGNSARADAQFRLAIRILDEVGKPGDLYEAHAAYAAVLESRGSLGLAGQHWKEAAMIGRMAALGQAGGTSRDKKLARRAKAADA
jgi:transcriptional regulator with XRE-family HTH domain